MRRLFLLLTFLLACMSSNVARTDAATTTIPHWTICTVHLDWATMTKVNSKTCVHIPMPKQSGKQPSGHWTRVTRLSPHVEQRLRYPTFPIIRPIFGLLGCPPAIARWADYIVPAARLYGLPVPVMTGVMQNESGGDPNAVNPASGASGLYQFLPSTAAYLGINPFNPAQATYAAARYIRDHGITAFSGGGYSSAWGCD